MENSNPLAPDLEHVEIAVSIKRIANVVAGDHDADARGLELMQRSHAAPARGAPAPPVLQEHVAHRQRHDTYPRFRNRLDRPPLFVLILERQRAAMADQDSPGEASPDRRLRDDAERTRGGIGGFIDVKIEVPALALGEREQNVEALAAGGESSKVAAPRMPDP